MIELPVISLPRAVPLQQERPPKENIPQTRLERERIRLRIRDYLVEHRLVPPLRMEELREIAAVFAQEEGIDAKYVDYVGVLFNNEVWRDTLASVPYERRLLLLPKCMRIEEKCPAPFDEFGLLCKQCGLCSIQDLQEEAERLGYAVLVAEGSALVTSIIATGKIEAIVGVSCLSVLEKAFPYMEAAAIPGVAIPLLQDDCKDVTVDLEWVWEIVHLTSEDTTYRLNLDDLRAEVQTWFEPEALEAILGPSTNETEQLARHWLAKEGKRWRPFLAVCVWKALQDDPALEPSAAVAEDLRRIAIAVECFHKASLIHDDIEDEDAERYGEATLHHSHGVAMALNVGDLLLGEGYRVLAECKTAGRRLGEMLRVAAVGHRTLCMGQGDELSWARNPQALEVAEVLSIFRRKTSPAFEVALQLGALLADADDEVFESLTEYSNALGVAYQIRDDIDDMDHAKGSIDPSDLEGKRPTLPLAVLFERTIADKGPRALVTKAWQRKANSEELEEVRTLFTTYDVETRCKVLQESFKEEALRVLSHIDNATLKGLLRRVVSKIFSIELKGWCRESEAGDGASSPAGAQDAGGLHLAGR